MFKSSPSQFMTIIYSMEYDGQLNGELNGTLNGILNGTDQSVWIKRHVG